MGLFLTFFPRGAPAIDGRSSKRRMVSFKRNERSRTRERLAGPITKNQVAALLKDFEIRPVVVHPTKRADISRHGYRAAQFEDAIARFLPREPNIRTLKLGGGEKT
jgi:Protein of unknown function (DUF3631)